MKDESDSPGASAGTARSKVTLREIAELSGVSISTVSRALSGSPGLSETVRSRVQSAADRLNYIGSGGPGISVTVLSNIDMGLSGPPDFQVELFAGIERECRDLDLPLAYVMMGEGQLPQIAASTTDGDRRGIILLSFHDETLIGRLVGEGVPAVIVNGIDPGMRLDAVSAGNRSGGFAAARHLIDLGHHRILHLTHGARRPVRDRLHGARDAIEAAGLAFDGDLVIDLAVMRSDAAYAAVRDRLAAQGGKPDFTAIQCCNDASAFGAMTAVEDAGLSIPGDISIVGFDDIRMAAMTHPPLTTVQVPRQEIGGYGLRRLLERMRSPQATVTYTEFAGPLIVRRSTAPAKASRLG
ncbi:LacI family DNA-binding transcriptional regulator [Rhizobium halophytocola]|uniref:DNA-binding LacI/PurR family transcriptional regulator n=1 Tax=Rhizobium halophytocola TaxID=735519 RepID=A0ABS4E4S5_9HYPH|nr:LacI family DNA-binding transcriptional regulator [Rhizobium halophytocola]MBP1852917.1 DNA-binding LacI/PurR family transcriptional regulator [Rhizobium halophytocola]